MQFLNVTLHEGAPDGPAIQVFIPIADTDQANTGDPFRNISWEEKEAAYPGIFSMQTTFLVAGAENAEYLGLQGFVNKIRIDTYVSSTQPTYNLYLDATHYVQISRVTSTVFEFRLYDEQGLLAPGQSLSTGTSGNRSFTSLIGYDAASAGWSLGIWYGSGSGTKAIQWLHVDTRYYPRATRENIIAFWNKGLTPTDPYAGAGDSGPGGGGGDYDYTGDPPGGWDPTTPPGISAVDTGFVTLYNPTAAELKSLASYLWSTAFDLTNFKKLFSDPMDSFIGLSIVPVAVPDGPRRDVGVGGVATGIYMTQAGQQYIPVDCGTVYIKNFSGSYLDYDPYTKVEIFLPYIGTRTLKADEVVGHNLHVGYWVDILSGACTAWLDVDGAPMYQFMGQCATALPMASGEWTNLINGIIGAVGSVAAGVATGGAGAIAGGVAAASAVAVTDGKMQVERSGAVTSAAGLMGLQVPTLFINTPHLHKPAAQNSFEGYPAYFTAALGDMKGFTIVENIILQGIPATEPELQEIKTLLKGGVIL